MKEEAIARGEEFPEEESSEEDDDPGNIPMGDNASVLTHVSNNIMYLTNRSLTTQMLF